MLQLQVTCLLIHRLFIWFDQLIDTYLHIYTSGVINLQHLFLALLFSVAESPGEGSREGDSTGVRSGHDSVQGAEATREPRAAEVR